MTTNSGLFGSQDLGLSPTQLYPATVEYNSDPSCLGRVKARVAQLFDGIPTSELPWAIPTFEHPDGATSDSGILLVPKVGSKVLLYFQNGSPFHPVYRGYTVDALTKLEEATTNYPDRAVIRFKNGLVFVIDTKTNEVFIRNPGDVHALIEGNLDLTIMGSSTTRINGNSEHIVNGNENIRVKGNKTDIVSSNRDELTKGNARKFIKGESGHYAGGNATRVATNIYDNPSAGAPADPAEPVHPSVYTWPGILKGGLPSKIWKILKFW